MRKLEYNFANKNVWLQANLLISIYLNYNIVILTWSVIVSPLYLSNLWSQQIHLFPTINILKCWRPRDKIGEHALPSVKIRIARNTKTRRLLFCIQCIECVSYFNFRCHKFVGVSEEADMAKKRTSLKVKKNKSLLIFSPFARPHNRESRKELNWAWSAGVPIFSVRVKYNFSRMTLLKFCTTRSLINVKKKYILYLSVYYGFEIAFGSETKDRIPFFADRGKIELRSASRSVVGNQLILIVPSSSHFRALFLFYSLKI